MKEQDSLRRFIFTDAGVRGEWVSLSNSWRAIKNKHPYPVLVERQLGQVMAAVVLLAVTVKFKGSMILQTQGEGPLRLLVGQCNNERKIRGMARYNQAGFNDGEPEMLYGQGRLILTIEQEQGEPYQGIVELCGDDLALSLQSYFEQSEQLPTRLWLFADENRAAGLLLQELPDHDNDPNDWRRIKMLADTLTEREIMRLSCEQMLYRLFHEEKVRLFDPEPVNFGCSCCVEKIEATLLGLGRKMLEEILLERDDIVVDCEFCNHQYRFDRVDIERVLSQAGNKIQVSGTHH